MKSLASRIVHSWALICEQVKGKPIILEWTERPTEQIAKTSGLSFLLATLYGCEKELNREITDIIRIHSYPGAIEVRVIIDGSEQRWDPWNTDAEIQQKILNDANLTTNKIVFDNRLEQVLGPSVFVPVLTYRF
jgi:hypothetical protein